jgi:putative ABC transport system permease protein
MKAILTLSWSYLQKNKVQNLFITLLIFLTTILMTTAVTVMSSSQDKFNDMHTQQNAVHQKLKMTENLHDEAMVQEWWSAQPGVEATPLLNYRLTGGFTFGGKETIDLFFFMMQTPDITPEVDKLLFTQGEQTMVPPPGSVWIPTDLANTFDMQVGDTFSVRAEDNITDMELTVAGVVIDIAYGGPFTNTTRIWMNPADYRVQYPSPAQDDYMMELRFADYDANMQIWKAFEEELGEPYLEDKEEFEVLSAFYFLMGNIIGFIMIFLGLVMLLIALITIGFSISDTLLASYKTIGILKALGLTTRSTVTTYALQYGLLALIAVIPGVLLGSVLSGWIVNLTISNLDTGEPATHSLGLLLLIGMLVIAFVQLFVILYARRARNIKPAQAIRYGMSETDSSAMHRRMNGSIMRRFNFERFPFSLVIALRNLWKNRKGSILMVCLSLLASAVLIFCFSIILTLGDFGPNSGEMGYDESDINIVVQDSDPATHQALQQYLQQDDRIEDFSIQVGGMGIVQGQTEELSVDFVGLSNDYDTFGYETLRGNNPRAADEIALGLNVAKETGKQLGDTILVNIRGEQYRFTVSGIYQAIAYASNQFRIMSSAVSGSEETPGGYIMNTRQPEDVDALVNEINAQFGDIVTAVPTETLINSVFNQASMILLIPMSVIALLFVGVTFLIIYSITRINVRKEEHTYGIYKSLGMTSRRVRGSVTSGILYLTGIGALLGVPIAIFVLPKLLTSVTTSYGVVEIPLTFGFGVSAGCILLIVLTACLGAWISTAVVKRTSPQALILE